MNERYILPKSNNDNMEEIDYYQKLLDLGFTEKQIQKGINRSRKSRGEREIIW
tara:strand:- start:116 stop:274 length:159 start_codon:yes stop_codon:yes gene_type:complete